MIVAGSRHILYSMFMLMFCSYTIESEKKMIYILSWYGIRAFDGTVGQQYFIKNKCSFQNCFFTTNRSFFKDVSYFDVILFNSLEICASRPRAVFPPVRSPEQKYIFVASEASAMYPISYFYDGFFNYTFTYKLDSDVPWKFVVVRNKSDNKIIAPSTKRVKWIDVNDMEPVSEDIKRKLQSKTQAATWMVSHCRTVNKREIIVKNLITELEKYNLSISTTGTEQCVDPYDKLSSPCSYWNSRERTYSKDICFEWISATHYFYLAFENSMSEDYLTEKVLAATKNYAIPIVFGGADYTKFLPPGSYIYANDLKPKDLASLMNELIHDKNKYYEYFKWHRYYSIEEPTDSAETNGICALCAFLNDETLESKSSVYKRITLFFKA